MIKVVTSRLPHLAKHAQIMFHVVELCNKVRVRDKSAHKTSDPYRPAYPSFCSMK